MLDGDAQAMAIILDSRTRVLLPDVGNYLLGPTTPVDSAGEE
jgi:hypothetical protein